jgi:hypothetical protein
MTIHYDKTNKQFKFVEKILLNHTHNSQNETDDQKTDAVPSGRTSVAISLLRIIICITFFLTSYSFCLHFCGLQKIFSWFYSQEQQFNHVLFSEQRTVYLK